MSIKYLIGLVMTSMVVFSIAVILLFSAPIKAETDYNFACEYGAEKLNDYVDRIKKMKTRTNIIIDNSGKYQIVMVMIEGHPFGQAMVFMNQCLLFNGNGKIQNIAIQKIYDVNLKEAFPAAKKDSY